MLARLKYNLEAWLKTGRKLVKKLVQLLQKKALYPTEEKVFYGLKLKGQKYPRLQIRISVEREKSKYTYACETEVHFTLVKYPESEASGMSILCKEKKLKLEHAYP